MFKAMLIIAMLIIPSKVFADDMKLHVWMTLPYVTVQTHTETCTVREICQGVEYGCAPAGGVLYRKVPCNDIRLGSERYWDRHAPYCRDVYRYGRWDRECIDPAYDQWRHPRRPHHRH